VITSGAAFWIADHADGAARWLMVPLLYVAPLVRLPPVFSGRRTGFAGSVAGGERLRFLDSTKWLRKLKLLAGDFAKHARACVSPTRLPCCSPCLVQDVLTVGDMYMFAHFPWTSR